MITTPRIARALAATFAVLAFTAAPAFADAGESEPNDKPSTATGPLHDGLAYDGVFEDRGDNTDLDYFSFVPVGTSVTIVLKNITQDCQQDDGCGIGLRVVDAGNDLVNGGSTVYQPNTVRAGDSVTVTAFELTAGTTYYVQVTANGMGPRYAVSASGVKPKCPDDGEAVCAAPPPPPCGSPGADPCPEPPAPCEASDPSCVPTGTCQELRDQLATADERRDTDKAAYDKVRGQLSRSRSESRKKVLRLEVERRKNQLLDDLKQASNLLKALRAQSCSCQLDDRAIERDKANLKLAKSDLKAERRKRRSVAQRRNVSRLAKRVRALQADIAKVQRDQKRRNCPSTHHR